MFLFFLLPWIVFMGDWLDEPLVDSSLFFPVPCFMDNLVLMDIIKAALLSVR